MPIDPAWVAKVKDAPAHLIDVFDTIDCDSYGPDTTRAREALAVLRDAAFEPEAWFR